MDNCIRMKDLERRRVYQVIDSIVYTRVDVAMVTGLMEYFINEYNRPLEAKDHVIQLTKSNFRATVNEGDLTLVEFYAPW